MSRFGASRGCFVERFEKPGLAPKTAQLVLFGLDKIRSWESNTAFLMAQFII